MTFLNKSYGEFNEVDDPVIVLESYEGSGDEDYDEIIWINNENNNNDYSDDLDSKSKKEMFLRKTLKKNLKWPQRHFFTQKLYKQ